MQRLYEGEKYIEEFKIHQKQNMLEVAKNLTTNGFRYPSGNKRSTGLGGYWGCIGPKLAHEPEYTVVKHGDKPGEVIHEPRQMLTCPMKLGYGSTTPGCIFGPGPKPGVIGMDCRGRYGGKEFENMSDPYDLAQKKERADRQAAAATMEGKAPFKTMTHALDFFDSWPRVASSKVWTEEPRVPERKPKESEFAPVAERAFYPARAPRSGPLGTFLPFPKYMEDPLEEKMKLAKAAAAAAKLDGIAPFKPTGKPHSTPSPSIVFHTIGPKPTS